MCCMYVIQNAKDALNSMFKTFKIALKLARRDAYSVHLDEFEQLYNTR